ncbi:MAG: type III-B CRISPR module-associated Cmr3 family protein [Cyanobacteria bacterium P01_E01_bin.42]
MQLTESQSTTPEQADRPPFQYLVIIEPLGLLYGSAGRFLSPENLVGRSGQKFPPSATALSGICSAVLSAEKSEGEEWSPEFRDLQLAGPFWAWGDKPQNFYVPTPFNCWVKNEKIKYRLQWQPEPVGKWQVDPQELPTREKEENPPVGKFRKGTWLAIESWRDLEGETPPAIAESPWKFMPHLHPRLQEDGERVVDADSDRGSLFLENAVQLNPDACLIYLSNTEIKTGCYRFGGEGHLVELRCEKIGESVQDLLREPIGKSFALITPGIWGSNDYSYRAPKQNKQGELLWGEIPVEALLTERPIPARYRRGDRNSGVGVSARLSRGRYAMPAGSVCVLERPLERSWQDWPDAWFPKEGTTFKRWGSALSLPLSVTSHQSPVTS